MKKLVVLLMVLGLVIGVSGLASATIWGTTTGSGSAATVGTPYNYVGNFNFTPPALQTIMGDVGQYRLDINSLGNVPAYDVNGGSGAINSNGNYQWVIENTAYGPGATLYGSVVSWNFIPDSSNAATGSVTGSLQSNGFVHWYYGYDESAGGMTSLASLGVSDTFDFAGRYQIDDSRWTSNGPIYYALTGTVSANAVPEPATMLLFGLGLLGLAGVRRKLKK